MASEENDCTYKNEKKYENIIINYKNILNDRNREIGKLKYLLVENVSNLEKIKKKNVVYEERIGKYKKERRGNDSFLVGILFLIFVTLFIYYEIYDLIYIFLLFNSV